MYGNYTARVWYATDGFYRVSWTSVVGLCFIQFVLVELDGGGRERLFFIKTFPETCCTCVYRWFLWGVASLPEGKSRALCLVQLCAKYRLVSATLSPYH